MNKASSFLHHQFPYNNITILHQSVDKLSLQLPQRTAGKNDNGKASVVSIHHEWKLLSLRFCKEKWDHFFFSVWSPLWKSTTKIPGTVMNEQTSSSSLKAQNYPVICCYCSKTTYVARSEFLFYVKSAISQGETHGMTLIHGLHYGINLPLILQIINIPRSLKSKAHVIRFSHCWVMSLNPNSVCMI